MVIDNSFSYAKLLLGGKCNILKRRTPAALRTSSHWSYLSHVNSVANADSQSTAQVTRSTFTKEVRLLDTLTVGFSATVSSLITFKYGG